MHDSNHCAECGRAIDVPQQHFCPACGQPTPVHRVDWHFLGHELEHSLLHMDRGLLFTLKSLVLRPGVFIRAYLAGRRAGHVRPVMLISLMAAILTVASTYLAHADIVDAGHSMDLPSNSRAAADGLARHFTVALEWINHHYAWAALLLLPIEASAFQLAFRRFRHLNYPEWLVITAYLTGLSFLIQTVLVLFDHWLPDRMLWAGILSLGYMVFALAQFFEGYPKWKSALRALWGMTLYQITMMLVGAAYAAAMLAAHVLRAG